jgi:hypothetical protein
LAQIHSRFRLRPPCRIEAKPTTTNNRAPKGALFLFFLPEAPNTCRIFSGICVAYPERGGVLTPDEARQTLDAVMELVWRGYSRGGVVLMEEPADAGISVIPMVDPMAPVKEFIDGFGMGVVKAVRDAKDNEHTLDCDTVYVQVEARFADEQAKLLGRERRERTSGLDLDDRRLAFFEDSDLAQVRGNLKRLPDNIRTQFNLPPREGKN